MSEIAKHYELLEVKGTASIEEVKEAYRGLVKVWHPDRFGGDPKLQIKAQEKLKEINLAYEAVMRHRGGKSAPTPSPSSPEPKRPTSATNDAQQFYKTGMDYFEGKVTAKNSAEAAKWFKKAAELGHSSAQYYMGFLYSSANALPLDFAAAFRWYTMAAEQKNGAAMYQLGVLYAKGAHKPAGVKALKHIGLELGDKVEAHKWLYLATIYGVKEAITYIHHNNDATPLTAAGANEARLRSAYLFPEYPETSPRDLLAELVRTFLTLMRDGRAANRKGDQQLYSKILAKFANLEDAVPLLVDQTYATAKSEFYGLALSSAISRWKYLLGANETHHLVKQCAGNLVYYAAGRLPLDFAVLRAQKFNYIWVKEVMPDILAQAGRKE